MTTQPQLNPLQFVIALVDAVLKLEDEDEFMEEAEDALKLCRDVLAGLLPQGIDPIVIHPKIGHC